MGIFVSREDVRHELEQVKAQFDARVTQMESTILAEVRQIHTSEESVKDALLQHTHSVPRFPQEIYQAPANVTLLQARIDNFSKQLAVLNDVTEQLRQLTSQVEDLRRVVDHLSPTSPNGEPKSIHAVIGAHTQKISDAVENIHTAHSHWLNEQIGGLEKAGQAAANLQELLNISKQNISPQTDAAEIPQETVTPEQGNHV